MGEEGAAVDSVQSRNCHSHLTTPPINPEEWASWSGREGATKKWGHLGACGVRGIP